MYLVVHDSKDDSDWLMTATMTVIDLLLYNEDDTDWFIAWQNHLPHKTSIIWTSIIWTLNYPNTVSQSSHIFAYVNKQHWLSDFQYLNILPGPS